MNNINKQIPFPIQSSHKPDLKPEASSCSLLLHNLTIALSAMFILQYIPSCPTAKKKTRRERVQVGKMWTRKWEINIIEH